MEHQKTTSSINPVKVSLLCNGPDDFTFDYDFIATMDRMEEKYKHHACYSYLRHLSIALSATVHALSLPYIIFVHVNESDGITKQQSWEKILDSEVRESFVLPVNALCWQNYCAVYFAYECFLLDCTKQLTKKDKLRIDQRDFKAILISVLNDPEPTYSRLLGCPKVNLAECIRHSFAHNGGKATKKILGIWKQAEPQYSGVIAIENNANILISPSAVKRLRTDLIDNVECFLDKVKC